MQINITNHFTEDGREYFRFDLYDGPDNVEHVEGFAVDLVQAFAKLLEWRERIAADYNDSTDNETN